MKPTFTDIEMVQGFVLRKYGFRLLDDEAQQIVLIIGQAKINRIREMSTATPDRECSREQDGTK